MHRSLKTVLIGFGKIAQGNAFDPKMTASMKYSSHAQVLAEHPGYSWCGVVDPDPSARETAASVWRVPEATPELSSLSTRALIEVAVLATPPDQRLFCLEQLPALKAVLVEKPMGFDDASSRQFLEECARRGIVVQVNFLRRADELTRSLAEHSLHAAVGKVQCVFGIYCRGLRNNAVHIIDLARMFFGEVVSAQAYSGRTIFFDSPIPGDANMPFSLVFDTGVMLQMQPVRIECYRENGLDIWGEKGRMSYLNGGFSIAEYKLRASLHVDGEVEIDIEHPKKHMPTLGNAFYHMYSNLAEAVRDARIPLVSSGVSAFKTNAVVEAILVSLNENGSKVYLA